MTAVCQHPVRILITDSVTLNTGDAAILFGTIEVLRTVFGNCEIRTHCRYYDRVLAKYPDIAARRCVQECTRKFPPRFVWRLSPVFRYAMAVRGRSLWRAICRRVFLSSEERAAVDDYAWADVIISCGGSFLTDSYAIKPVLAGYYLALTLEKKVIILGQTLGPFADHRNVTRVQAVISKFDLIVTRDEQSWKMAMGMGIPAEKLVLAADMAFNLPVPEVSRRADRERVLIDGRSPVVGVSVRRWIYPRSCRPREAHSRYVATLAKALDTLIERHDAKVVFISTCQGEPVYSFHDEEVADEVRSVMNFGDRTVVDRDFYKPDCFMEKASRMHVLIGTRMHACILAMLSGVPCLNIEYEPKSRELFRRLDLEKMVVGIETFSSEEVVVKVEILFEKNEQFAKKIKKGTQQLRELNFKAVNMVRNTSVNIYGGR